MRTTLSASRSEINDTRYVVTRRFDTPEDVVVASLSSEQLEVLPVVRRDGRRIFSDWILEALSIHVVTLYLGTYRGKLNFTDLLRLVYHDQDPDPSRVFKKLERDNFVTDSRDFRRAVFEIAIGQASEEYYQVLGELKQAEAVLADRVAALAAYKAAVARASTTPQDVNAHFLREAIAEKEKQQARLERTRAQLRRSAPNAASADAELTAMRRELAAKEMALADVEGRANETTSELIRLRALEEQLIDEVVRIQKIIHAHETLALFSPDTCPCCLRKVDRAAGHCICGQPVDEASYQRFFYSSDEYVSILKSKQKNVETVRSAITACGEEIKTVAAQKESLKAAATTLRQKMEKWAGGEGGAYGTELERVDDEVVEVRVQIERLKAQLDLELERDKLEGQASAARQEAERLRQRTQALELAAQQDRATKVARFDKVYSQLMRETLTGVRLARLDGDYEPVINEGEYREASATVTRRLMYYLTLLQMALADSTVPFPRFLLIDTPETAGIDTANLSRAIGKVTEVLSAATGDAQVVLTTGPDKYPGELKGLRVMTLTDDDRLLKRKDPT